MTQQNYLDIGQTPKPRNLQDLEACAKSHKSKREMHGLYVHCRLTWASKSCGPLAFGVYRFRLQPTVLATVAMASFDS